MIYTVTEFGDLANEITAQETYEGDSLTDALVALVEGQVNVKNDWCDRVTLEVTK